MTISRISKLLADKGGVSPADAHGRRSNHMVTLICGEDIAGSYVLQLAVLTAARVAVRCFPGAVTIVVPGKLHTAQSLVFPDLGKSFGAALDAIVGASNVRTSHVLKGQAVLLGDAPAVDGAIRVTFDGWIARVGPAATTFRMREREFCSLTGVLAGSLAISEIFLSFADISLSASRREISWSLWRPDLSPQHPDALGKPVESLPLSSWILGLGHLGNAYIWAISTLPYGSRRPKISLFDFDIVEDTNVEIGILFDVENIDSLKTRVLSDWLASHGFETRVIERRFDEAFRVQSDEPRLALCGFDSNPARRHLATAGFPFVVESGLGGLASNFDVINLHTFPNVQPVSDMWPDQDEAALSKERARQERIARENPAYSALSDDVCGRIVLAGKAIAVPFVGTTAAAFVIAEALKVFHGGPAYGRVRLQLGLPEKIDCRYLGNYSPDVAGVIGSLRVDALYKASGKNSAPFSAAS